MPNDKLADSLQTIAELRRELSQARAERDEALARETATAEVLGVINSSPGDLSPVFDAILEKALRLCEASFGALQTYDGELFHPVAVRHSGRSGEAPIGEGGPLRPEPGTTIARIAAGEDLIHIDDLRQEAAYRTGSQIRRALVDRRGARSMLSIALRKDDTLLGALHVYRTEARPFSNKQIALLQNFAAQAVIAMENARLLTETREALEQQTATAEVLQVINASPGDLAPVFDAIVDRAMRLCEAAFGFLILVDGEHLRAMALRNVPEGFATTMRQPMQFDEVPIVAGSASQAEVRRVADLAETDVYRLQRLPIAVAAVEQGGVRSVLYVPLIKDDRSLGVFVIFRQEVRQFTDKQIALLQNFAAQAVIAMENARLITETREALDQQTATAEVLQVINSSPGDLAPVFDAMLDKAMTLCGAAFGALMSYDGETVSAVATRGLPPELVDVFSERIAPRREGDAPYARFLRGEPLLHIADMAADDVLPSLASRPRALVEIGSARTGLEIPLRKEGALLGSIWLYRQEVRPFTDKQIALLQNFAAQAVIAMENARLITETREALEQQTATAEVLQVINASPGNLAPVFDAMLEKAMHLCEADFSLANTFDGERLRTVAERGVPPAFAEWRKRHIPGFGPGTGPARIPAGEKLLHTVDLMESEGYRAGDPDRRAIVDLGGARTHLIVALRKEDALLGTLAIYRQEVQPFTDKQIALLQNFAAQAVIAMENARLITETREALEQQTATAEVLQVINSSPGDLAPVFDAILEKAHTLCGATLGSLRLYDGKNIRAVALRGLPEAFAGELRQGNPLSDALSVRLLAGKPVHILDAAEFDHPMARKSFEQIGTRTILVVPLAREGALLGMIFAGRTEVRPFTDKQIALLQNFAAQAVIAMENARLITETRERTRDLQESLEYQTATSDVLGVISRSAGELDSVLQILVETAARICNADTGAIMRLSDGRYHLASVFGVTEEWADFVRRHPTEPGRGTITARVALERRIIHVDDVTADPEYTLPQAHQLGAFRTALGVPLLRDDRPIGVIALGRLRVKPFTEKQIQLVRTFADQAVIALENARLFGELRARTEEIAGWNKELEGRVAAQLAEIERTGKLRRFLAPQLADLILAQGDESILESHRREIVVVFCDLRGFTAFAERAEPEEVMALLKDYHAAMGPIVARFEGTIDHYGGDGIMVFFNDPLPTPDPARRAIDMAVAMREAAQALLRSWRRHGHDIGFGVGISQGYATLGQIGFAERMDYTAIGTVTNLAARLCAEAKDGQILVSRRIAIAVEDSAKLEEIGDLSLKGLSQAVLIYNVPLAPA